MKKLTFFFLFIGTILVVASCKKEEMKDPCVPADLSISNNSSRQKDDATLTQLLVIINERAQNNSCTATDSWKFAAIGIKACGGPLSFVAYNTKIDSVCFFKLANYYTEQTAKFNVKHNIISDCSVPRMPAGVKCEDGKPVFF